jgi:hypothetical protein
MKRALAVPIVLLLGACAAHRQTYLLRWRTLLPPAVNDAGLKRAAFVFPARKACRSRTDAIRVEPRGQGLRITVSRVALLAQPAPWLAEWAESLDQQGCIESGQAWVLAEEVVESLPMALHTGASVSGFIDLAPGQRLKTVSPIPFGRPIETESVAGSGNSLSLVMKSNLLGYQVAWWSVERNGQAMELKFVSAESHIGSAVTAPDHPDFRPNAGRDAAYIRLFYLTRVSQADHNVVLLFARTRQELERLTGAVTACPEGSCQAVPGEVAVSVYTRITAQGTLLDVPAPATVAAALRAAGVPDPTGALAGLSVRRTYHGRLVAVDFDRSKPDILSLDLQGGEELAW